MASPQKQLLDIIDSNVTSKEYALQSTTGVVSVFYSRETIMSLFDQLEPMTLEGMYGEWSGGPVETGHMTSKWCQDVNFAGKTFHSKNDVQPVFVFDADGNRKFHEPNGYARLREVKYRGVVTACLIYDSGPVMDYFRKIDEDTVLSAADNKNKPPEKMGTCKLRLSKPSSNA